MDKLLPVKSCNNMLKRKIAKELEEWAGKAKKKALLVKGASPDWSGIFPSLYGDVDINPFP